MKTSKLTMLVPVVLLVAACGRNSAKTDDALKNDLALASQAQPLNPNISPTEAGLATQNQLASTAKTTAARQPVSAPARRTSTARRSSGASRSSGSSGGYYPATPRTTVEKHTQRDAAIGAVAGAVIGATTSRNKVKGGVIGAAVGGILGGVIGNNVDKSTKTVP